jgi:chromosomal replication initiator protein
MMSTNYLFVWKQVLSQLKLSVSPAVFNTLFSQTQLKGIKKTRAIVACPSPYIADLIEKRHAGLVCQLLSSVLEKNINKIEFVATQVKKNSGQPGPLFAKQNNISTKKQDGSFHYDPKTGLHPRFTFANFVVGNSNNFAYAAAQGIIKNPGVTYNPFFVWGGVGVGKTHLVQAVGHEIAKTDSSKKVLYATAEAFANDLVSALRGKTVSAFKRKYRQPDVLIIDDVQFIAGKEYIQEEFFHTFNSLYIAEKQIILTSDRKPEEIGQIEDRLISRFMGGLTVDVQPPDFEMRLAIIKQKAEQKGISIPEDAVSFIAETVQSNARELEGNLSQIIARAESAHSPISLDFVKEFFGIKKTSPSKKVHYRRIISVVAKTFNIKTSELCGKTRKKQIALARHIAAYLLRRELQLPLKRVGELLGGRDHTTIIHAEEKIDRAFSTNQQIRHQIIQIQKAIYQ